MGLKNVGLICFACSNGAHWGCTKGLCICFHSVHPNLKAEELEAPETVINAPAPVIVVGVSESGKIEPRGEGQAAGLGVRGHRQVGAD